MAGPGHGNAFVPFGRLAFGDCWFKAVWSREQVSSTEYMTHELAQAIPRVKGHRRSWNAKSRQRGSIHSTVVRYSLQESPRLKHWHAMEQEPEEDQKGGDKTGSCQVENEITNNPASGTKTRRPLMPATSNFRYLRGQTANVPDLIRWETG